MFEAVGGLVAGQQGLALVARLTSSRTLEEEREAGIAELVASGKVTAVLVSHLTIFGLLLECPGDRQMVHPQSLMYWAGNRRPSAVIPFDLAGAVKAEDGAAARPALPPARRIGSGWCGCSAANGRRHRSQHLCGIYCAAAPCHRCYSTVLTGCCC